MHVDLVPGSSRPELPSAQVTNGPASRVASRNLDSTEPRMSSSNRYNDSAMIQCHNDSDTIFNDTVIK